MRLTIDTWPLIAQSLDNREEFVRCQVRANETNSKVNETHHHIVETVTLRKYVANYEQMRKWTFKFLRNFQGRGIKIAKS